jgi:hypothetical protein
MPSHAESLPVHVETKSGMHKPGHMAKKEYYILFSPHSIHMIVFWALTSSGVPPACEILLCSDKREREGDR